MKLGTLLLRDGKISLSQLEAALRNQILCGGRLGTNLVELDLIDVETLTRYLAEVRGVPAASHAMFESVDPQLVREFGAALAERFAAFPLATTHDNAVAVAVVDPGDSEKLDQLSQALLRKVVAHIAPELRIFYYIEKHYDITRKARFVREGTTEPVPAGIAERRRSHPPRGLAMPPVVRFEPRSHRAGKGSSSAAAAGDSRPSLSYREVCAAIDQADSREGIADVLVDYARGRFGLLAVFLLRDANAIGWRLYTAADDGDSGGEPGQPRIDQLSLALGGASALQEAHDAGAVYRGGATSPGRPIERALWQFLELEEPPAEMLVVPVLVKRRVVNLIYAHGIGHGAIDDTAAKKLAELAKRASRAYARLIQAAKSVGRGGSRSD
ncbi:MAG: hypothetical protein AAGC55_00800 [Myxococcota bacterium]